MIICPLLLIIPHLLIAFLPANLDYLYILSTLVLLSMIDSLYSAAFWSWFKVIC